MQIKQVVTETDWMNAIFEYIGEQLNGRFRLQFPSMEETIEDILEAMVDPLVRSSQERMMEALVNTTAAHGGHLTAHSLNGCPNKEGHDFQRELVNLIWSARSETLEWLNQQGIVPGQSIN